MSTEIESERGTGVGDPLEILITGVGERLETKNGVELRGRPFFTATGLGRGVTTIGVGIRGRA